VEGQVECLTQFLKAFVLNPIFSTLTGVKWDKIG